MLVVKDLIVKNKNTNNTLVERVDFKLDQGETLGLVGESGSGKTLSMLSLLDLLPHNLVADAETLTWMDTDLLTLKDKQLRSYRGGRIGFVFQEPMTALNPLHPVGDQIAEMILSHQYVRRVQSYVQELLELVELNHEKGLYHRLPHELSGGQRQRVLVAMAIANRPELLIADEPTTALDQSVKHQILDLLNRLKHEFGMSMILVTHDISSLRPYADSIVVMKKGKVVESGRFKAVINSPKDSYTCSLIAPRQCQPVVINDHRTILEVNGLSSGYTTKDILGFNHREVNILCDVSFQLQHQECLGVVGPSGTGKTTLAKALLRLCDATGSVQYEKLDWFGLDRKTLKQHRHLMQMIFQDPYSSLSPRMRVGDIIGEGLKVFTKLNQKEITKRVDEAIESVHLDPNIKHRYPHEFSGGQRQRISIARSIVLRPKILILDEPTASLDRVVGDKVLDLFIELQMEYGMSYLLISHDWSVIEAMAHRVVILDKGQIVEEGTPLQLRLHSDHSATQKMLMGS